MVNPNKKLPAWGRSRRVLDFLELHPSTTYTELSRKLQISRTKARITIHRLRQMGYVIPAKHVLTYMGTRVSDNPYDKGDDLER
jgi:DNA-binding IclR family transcriptional regulator